MRELRAAAPVILGGVLLSGAIVFAAGVWFLRIEDLNGTDKDWARIDGVFGMAFFALMVGLLSTVASAVLVRLLPLGLVAFAAAAIGIGLYVSSVAMSQKPDLAPMFLLLHVVFVVAFGIILPYRLYVARSRSSTRVISMGR